MNKRPPGGRKTTASQITAGNSVVVEEVEAGTGWSVNGRVSEYQIAVWWSGKRELKKQGIRPYWQGSQRQPRQGWVGWVACALESEALVSFLLGWCLRRPMLDQAGQHEQSNTGRALSLLPDGRPT